MLDIGVWEHHDELVAARPEGLVGVARLIL
jgi:hypothetical protein